LIRSCPFVLLQSLSLGLVASSTSASRLSFLAPLHACGVDPSSPSVPSARAGECHFSGRSIATFKRHFQPPASWGALFEVSHPPAVESPFEDSLLPCLFLKRTVEVFVSQGFEGLIPLVSRRFHPRFTSRWLARTPMSFGPLGFSLRGVALDSQGILSCHFPLAAMRSARLDPSERLQRTPPLAAWPLTQPSAPTRSKILSYIDIPIRFIRTFFSFLPQSIFLDDLSSP
jgi:hypothetical protein